MLLDLICFEMKRPLVKIVRFSGQRRALHPPAISKYCEAHPYAVGREERDRLRPWRSSCAVARNVMRVC
jgi:hypothetical protein